MPPKKRSTESLPLSRDQKIEAALNQFRGQRVYENTPPPVASRVLRIGDCVEVGHLDDCVVVAVFEEGRFVAIEYSKAESESGQTVKKTGCFGVWPWTECFRISEIQDTHFSLERSRVPAYRNSDVSYLIHVVISRGSIDTPDYQRGYAWTLADKVEFIDSVFNERALGSFLFVDYPYERYEGRLEVLDGKQRLNALVDFYTSKFPYRGKFFHELSARDRGKFQRAAVQFAHLDGERTPRADLLQIFLDVNVAGVPQTDEHLAHVRALLAAETKTTPQSSF